MAKSLIKIFRKHRVLILVILIVLIILLMILGFIIGHDKNWHNPKIEGYGL